MMDTTEGELTADDMAIFYAFENEIAGEEPGPPSADAGGAWTLVGRGGGGSGGGGVEAASAEDTGLDLSYTPMNPTSPGDLGTSMRDTSWVSLLLLLCPPFLLSFPVVYSPRGSCRGSCRGLLNCKILFLSTGSSPDGRVA